MVYAYYHKLNRTQQRIYEHSDAIATIPIATPEQYHDGLWQIHTALENDNRVNVERICNLLVKRLTDCLATPSVKIKVKAKRPSNTYGELHGLYEPAEGGFSAIITLWMRTAQRKQVVAVRTFLRTLLHELCHHLDYEYLKLADSFHTEGFYKRESSLFQQLTQDIDLPSRRKKTG